MPDAMGITVTPQHDQPDIALQYSEQVGKRFSADYLAVSTLILEHDPAGWAAVPAEVDDIRLMLHQQILQIVGPYRPLRHKLKLIPERAEANLLTDLANLFVDS